VIVPMVARLVGAPFDQDGWFFELKWDGFRGIAELDGQGSVKLYSRRQNDFTRRFRPVVQALAELGRPATLDGEIVALNEQGHPRFEWLLNRGTQKGTLVYYVFDLLAIDGKDLRQTPLRERKKKLEQLLKGNERVRYVDHMENDGLAMYAGALVLGLEGIVAKDSTSHYTEGPTNNMALAKNQESRLQEEGEDRFQ